MPLWLAIGLFIWRLPKALEREPLDIFLKQLSRHRRRHGHDVDADVHRISRIRRRWLRLAPWRRHNTCYTRALVLFTYLDARGGTLRFHLGTEPSRQTGDNIHGHAWVSLDGRVLEPLPPTIAERVVELYAYPAHPGESPRASGFEHLTEKSAAEFGN